MRLSAAELKKEVQDQLDSNFALEFLDTNNYEENERDSNNDVLNIFSSAYHSSKRIESKNINESKRDLRSYLRWQLQLSKFSKIDREIAEEIIKNINSDGFLIIEESDLYKKFRNVSNKKISLILNRIQRFDPPGVGAFNLQESLLIQVKQLPNKLDCKEIAIELLKKNFQLFLEKNFQKLKESMEISNHELKRTFLLIRLLSPFPGREINKKETSYIKPEILVRKKSNEWAVELMTNALPRIKINSKYAELIKKSDDYKNDKRFQNDLRRATWLIESLRKREKALLQVSKCIMNFQLDFLQYGQEAIKPMKLEDIASIVGLHQSTISRITNKKYVQTPNGIFELKFFFSKGSKMNNGKLISSLSIKEKIKKIIKLEASDKPYSDQKIKEMLKKEGIDISRRAITKYRENLSLPSSYERKKNLLFENKL